MNLQSFNLGNAGTPVLKTSAGLALAASNTKRAVLIQNCGTGVVGISHTQSDGTEVALYLPACTANDDGTSMPIILHTMSAIYVAGSTVRTLLTPYTP